MSAITVKGFRSAAFRAGMSPTSASYQAAQAVLVDEMRQTDAAIRYGVTRATVSEAVARIRTIMLGGGICPMCLRPMEAHEAAA